MSLWCTEKECIDEYRSYKKLCSGVDGDESDSAADYDDADDILHCESPNCHTLYLRDHSGEICDYCGANYCQGCASDEKCTLIYDTDFVCRDCLIHETNNGNIDYCQNRKKDCKNFVYMKGTDNFQCIGCKIILCSDCEISLLYKGKCLTCRHKQKKKKNVNHSSQ
jgi:hypothetical protein